MCRRHLACWWPERRSPTTGATRSRSSPSAPLWLVLGLIASRRATQAVVASWRDYWRELLWLTIAVMAGAMIALLIATSVLGESLIL